MTDFIARVVCIALIVLAVIGAWHLVYPSAVVCPKPLVFV